MPILTSCSLTSQLNSTHTPSSCLASSTSLSTRSSPPTAPAVVLAVDDVLAAPALRRPLAPPPVASERTALEARSKLPRPLFPLALPPRATLVARLLSATWYASPSYPHCATIANTSLSLSMSRSHCLRYVTHKASMPFDYCRTLHLHHRIYTPCEYLRRRRAATVIPPI